MISALPSGLAQVTSAQVLSWPSPCTPPSAAAGLAVAAANSVNVTVVPLSARCR
jgi:hypothetical protein